MAKKFDAIIIGTGQSGPSLAARMTREGMKTAIIERKLFGGTCVNVGCIPTKTLVASARAAYVARRGEEFGVQFLYWKTDGDDPSIPELEDEPYIRPAIFFASD